MLGATNKEIAEALGIGASTLSGYKKSHPELMKALRSGTRKLVIEIKASLLKQALGYREKDIRVIKKGDTIVSTEIYERFYPPNERACAMLLRNYDTEFIEKGIDLNMQSIADEISKTGLVKITDDISEALRRADEEAKIDAEENKVK